LESSFEKILLSTSPTKTKFENILRNHALVVATNSNLVRIIFQEGREIPEKVRLKISKKRADYSDKLIELYKKGMREGVFKEMDPKIAVYFMLGACNWLCMWSPRDKRGSSPEEMVEQVTKILREGYEL
jgi:hypothetical protein